MRSLIPLSLFLVVSAASGQVPVLNKEKLANYKSLKPYEKSEIGTFTLLYSLTSKGLIGGDSGVCVNYTPGDASGSADKITFGFKTAARSTGKSNTLASDRSEVDRLKPMLKQLQTFFERGCSTSKCVDVNITGYSDGQRKEGEASPTVSYKYNEQLAVDRAKSLGSLIGGSLGSRADVNFQGRPSEFGQYVDIIAKQYGGDYEKFLVKASPSEKNFVNRQEHLDRLKLLKVLAQRENLAGESLLKKYKYKTNCPARRVTTMDFKFNSQQIKFEENNLMSVSPPLYAGGEKFNSGAVVDATMQVAGLVGKTDLSTKTDAELDAVVEQLMRKNGIADENIISTCKEPKTRALVKYISANLAQFDAATFAALTDPSMAQKTLVEAMTANRANPQNTGGKVYRALVNRMSPAAVFRVGQAGISSTALNCFSAVNTLKALYTEDSGKLRSSCQPIADNGNVHVQFKGKHNVHIGCKDCGTGLRMKEVVVTDARNGTQSKRFIPDYKIREDDDKGDFDDDPNSRNTYKSVEELDQVVDLLTRMGKIHAETNPKMKEDHFKCVYSIVPLMSQGYFSNSESVLYYATKHRGRFIKTLKETYGISDQECDTFITTLLGFSEDTSTAAEQRMTQYISAKLQGKPDPAKHYKPFLMLNSFRSSSDNKARLTVGGLKDPSYYVLDNCDCTDPNIVDRVITSGTRHDLGDVSDVPGKPGSCIVALPVPTSCMVSPNNPEGDMKAATESIAALKWYDADGVEQIASLAGDGLKDKFASLNQSMEFQGCTETDPLALAQQAVNSAACDKNSGIHIPVDEFTDCENNK